MVRQNSTFILKKMPVSPIIVYSVQVEKVTLFCLIPHDPDQALQGIENGWM